MSENKRQGKELYEVEKFLQEYSGPDRVVKSAELLEEIQKNEAPLTFNTGVASLDRILGGVEPGELIVVTGPTGEGKTTLLMTITKNIAAMGERSLWFTLEVTPSQFMEKLKMSTDELPDFLIPRASIDMAEPEYMKGWEKKYNRPYETMDWVEDRLIEAKVKYDNEDKQLRFVFIDHIHMLFSLNKMQKNISLELGDLVARIKYWALFHHVVVFLIAHSKDVGAEQSLREPRKEDIRDSGMISRLADDIIGVWRIRNDNDGTKTKREQIREDDIKSKVMIFKNRRKGRLGFFTMWHKDHYLSEDVDWGELE